ncbi:MAG TPA: carbamoyltransferase HypF [Desulfuromonadaceae bacterium]|jgi:hydrogenase maturation protein HypF
MAEQRDQAIDRNHLVISGIVQGVGFRPFVFRLARQLSLTGWVRNTPAGVEIEIQGEPQGLIDFEQLLSTQAPPLAAISSISSQKIPSSHDKEFLILPSAGGIPAIQVAPDSALCEDCRQELFDPSNRRYRYPFITCTNCGPRYSIITGIPYDRPNTTMSAFPLCPDCLKEYHDPSDRRFHAQPNACQVCGPQLQLLDKSGAIMAERDAAISRAITLLQEGAILAVKGIGGYHLALDACNNAAVQRLRERKKRDQKPFAVMAADLATAHRLALFNEQEERLLISPEAPIVIVRKATSCPIAPLVAPDNGWLGLLLPYAPLHHLLLAPHPAFGHPLPTGEGEMNSLALGERERERADAPTFQALVMTSANCSDEPIIYQNVQALQGLSGIADYFLTHNRPIHIRSDDSVMRVFQGKPLFYRRSRGYAPRSIRLPFEIPTILAVGAELKGVVCLAGGDRAFLSQHIGDLQNSVTCDSFSHTIDHLVNLLELKPQVVACDMHPDYQSSIYAAGTGLPVIPVQHHHAHMAACMAENGLEGEVIGIILDGTGYGSDDTIWGGEFLVGGYAGFKRTGHLRSLPLPGGDQAIREPWRMALAYLFQALGKQALVLDLPINGYLTDQEKELFCVMLEKRLNSPLTSSCGRLFDAVAALLDIRHIVSYDGQAAIELEALAETVEDVEEYPYHLRKNNLSYPSGAPVIDDAHGSEERDEVRLVLDFSPLFPVILKHLAAGLSRAIIARRFHNTIATAACEMCTEMSKLSGLERVVLSGGVFQNRLLSEMIYTGLSSHGFQVFTHRLIPPNDGGIAIGQAAVAGSRKNEPER